ncbi:hypothetical protein [Actinoplanes lobatus]|uniref:Uncharacterized protein n=1 Tax=Actinoplanes lobatus TaxID=113568 RepID=A0A7W7MKV5_9ACTN|nr:hypothetical protein [Actinoplanes lobatus]MBB4754084.1 hypothetical protein [Actinoplanes lobatus]
MLRMRVLSGLAVSAVVVGLLVPATAASAATPLRATITCDAATGVITTSASGSLFVPGPAKQVTVEFQRRTGVRVTATARTVLAPLAQPFRVTTTSTTSGDVSAAGYTGTFDPVTALFYREQLTVTFKDAATGATLTTREATCDHDQRTSVTLTCDPVAGTVTAVVDGVSGTVGDSSGGGSASRVSYHIATIKQQTPNVPTYRNEILGGGWDIEHRVVSAADGTWSDTGYVHTISGNPYRYSEEVTVGVFDLYGIRVGTATGACTLFDGSQTS